jgi:hypothetical protein
VLVLTAAAERIRTGILAYLAAGPAARNAIVRDVRGRSESILATLRELVEAAEVEAAAGRYGLPGALALPPVETPARWAAAWAVAGRPMPVPEWERAGRPGRRAWSVAGGRFSFDATDRDAWPDCTCEQANGGRRCRHLRCHDCRPQPDGWRFEAAGR